MVIEKVYTVNEVAKCLGVKQKTVRKLINVGELKAFNISSGGGRKVFRIKESELQRFMRSGVEVHEINSIESYLKYGEENAIFGEQLAEQLGLTLLELRQFVAIDRDAGVPICATINQGYYLAKNYDELRRYVDTQVAEMNRRCDRFSAMYKGGEKRYLMDINDCDLEVVNYDEL